MSSLHGCCCKRRESNNDNDDVSLISNEHENSLHSKDYESLDYDKCYNVPYREIMKSAVQKYGISFYTQKEILSWISIFIIGVLTALVAFFIDSIIRLLTNLKLSTVTKSLESCTDTICIVGSLFTLIGFNLAFVFVAAVLVVYGEPLAAGSGIPEIKCYLNGVKVRNVIRFRTLVSKAVGVLFSVSGGLLVGKEGPMIHSGGVIGGGIPQFESLTVKKLKMKVPIFRSDRDKRDFVSAGAAAGVAAAFGAPIGGVLFSLEEGCSFWNQNLTWKTLFCTMTSTFTLNFFLSGTLNHEWGSFSQSGLLTFGVFECPTDHKDCHLWTAGDLLIFIAMGLVGGVFGMLFNAINTKLTLFRLRYLAKKHKLIRVLEALLVALGTTLVVFLTPLFLKQCRKIDGSLTSSMLSDNFTETLSKDELQVFLCPNGTYNEMATLFYNSQEVAIKQLFHNSGAFSSLTLVVFFLLFFVLSCWTYGASVPSGLFVPCILCGAAYGQLVAALLDQYFGMEHIYPGTFSLIGAAAFLGGVVRMTISLTVILIECTNEITLSLPIMVTVMVAKWVGDLINEGLYDIHIELKSVPLLEWEAPTSSTNLTASQIMNTRLKFIYPHTRVRSLVDLLRTTAHNSFPVVTVLPFEHKEKQIETVENSNSTKAANLRYRSSSHVTRAQLERDRVNSHAQSTVELVAIDDAEVMPRRLSSSNSTTLEDNLRTMTFHGMILRTQLTTLLKNHISYKQQSGALTQNWLPYNQLNKDYPRFADIHDIEFSQSDLEQILDVTPYMHPCPHVAYPDSPVPQVFNLFRTMGLRHLPVINSRGEVLGLITRHNLTHHYVNDVAKKLQQSHNTAVNS